MKSRVAIQRRSVIEIGCLSMLGLNTSHLLAQGSDRNRSDEQIEPKATATRCILIWLDGGPSHLETFDPKPDASADVRGPLSAIPSNVPGIHLSECFQQLASRMDRFSIIRSMTSPLGEHNLGTHYLLTGYHPSPVLDYPSFCSILSWYRSRSTDASVRPTEFPVQVAIPDLQVGGTKFRSEGFLPAEVRPFSVFGDPAAPDFSVRNLTTSGLGIDRIERRRQFVEQIASLAESPAADSLQSARPELSLAFQMASSEAVRKAFDLSSEPEKTRNRYGSRTIGQSCLLARRLIENGVPFVTVNYRGWDTHANLYTQLKEGFTGARDPVGLIPNLDMALAALTDDLTASGLLDETLVLVMGEFGRTPKINAAAGRDHWPRVFSVALAGGGVQGGRVIGASDRTGELPADRPVRPEDLTASIFSLMGINPANELSTSDGRPIRLAAATAEPIQELWQ
ncbi:MAG: DUF1501 domain-containing protein [Planctomyces sp.]|nr:DUF1501 domain-containing protein [Planctomyces sp.]